jgi:hypothetical protein
VPIAIVPMKPAAKEIVVLAFIMASPRSWSFCESSSELFLIVTGSAIVYAACHRCGSVEGNGNQRTAWPYDLCGGCGFPVAGNGQKPVIRFHFFVGRGPAVRGLIKQFASGLFRPDEISILEDPFEDSWRRIESGKAPWASEEYSKVGRAILARYIIAMAKGGERDARWLADSAVLYLSQKKLTRKPPEALNPTSQP